MHTEENELEGKSNELFCLTTANTIHMGLFWEHNSGFTQADQNFI